MAGELIIHTSGSFNAGASRSNGDRVNYFNWNSTTWYAVGNPGGMVGKSYYSAIFNDAYEMRVSAGHTGGNMVVRQSLYVNDNDTTEYGLNFASNGDRSYYNSIEALWRNWGGDATVSYTFAAFFSATFKGIGSASTGKKLRIITNLGHIANPDGTNRDPLYAVNTLMTVAHNIVCQEA